MESDNGSNIGTVLLRGSDTPEYLPISYTCGQFQKKGVHPYSRQRREGAYPWIHCAKCSRRCARLYCVYGRFMCRQCGGLRYASDCLSNEKRRVKRIEQIYQQRLGYKHAPTDYVRRKPRMRWWTFNALHTYTQKLVRSLDHGRRTSQTTHRRSKYNPALMPIPDWKLGRRVMRIYRER